MGLVRGLSKTALDWFGAAGGLDLAGCGCKVDRPPVHLCSSSWLVNLALLLLFFHLQRSCPSSVLAGPRDRGRIYVSALFG